MPSPALAWISRKKFSLKYLDHQILTRNDGVILKKERKKLTKSGPQEGIYKYAPCIK